MSARGTRSAGTLLVAGTASDAGKSIVTTALCRALTARPGPRLTMTMAERPEPLLPLGLRLRGRRVVVVGGGPVALRRVGALLAAQTKVTVVAHRCCGDVLTSFPCRRR